jgi:membrane protease YdiL (CAAX protease family)
VPVVYALVEARFRRRSWQELGITRSGVVKGVTSNWHLFVIVLLVLQILIPWMSSLFWPDYLQHIVGRLPWSQSESIEALLGFLLVATFSTFIEELVFRGLTQERLGWFIPQSSAIVVASILFGFSHWAPGHPVVVLADIFGVILDGIFYGWICFRSRSILVSWTAHFLSDVVGLQMLLMYRLWGLVHATVPRESSITLCLEPSDPISGCNSLVCVLEPLDRYHTHEKLDGSIFGARTIDT